MLKGKHIVLGVTGSIAAYKAATLVRLLVKEGAEVKVMMTEMAKHFITPLTMATLSKNPVLVEFYNPENGDWNSHVSLGIWADLFLIAPASANTLAKMATGVADNLLLTTYLSAKCPVAIAPAMDLDMYAHVATQTNLNTLRERGVTIIEPESGELASGLIGKGRMEEPEGIVRAVKALFAREGAWKGRRVLLTVGPTREEIDPVRYITNHSTGKMGYALAEAFADQGAQVELVSGPVSIKAQSPNITVHNVVSAAQMAEKTLALYETCPDVTVLCAAVADYTPAERQDQKIKREKKGAYALELVPTVDIAAAIGQIKKPNTLTVGFALETNDAVAHAQDKLQRKNLDMIVMNSLEDPGAGFATDTNRVTLIARDGETRTGSLKSKQQVALDIVQRIDELLCCKD